MVSNAMIFCKEDCKESDLQREGNGLIPEVVINFWAQIRFADETNLTTLIPHAVK